MKLIFTFWIISTFVFAQEKITPKDFNFSDKTKKLVWTEYAFDTETHKKVLAQKLTYIFKNGKIKYLVSDYGNGEEKTVYNYNNNGQLTEKVTNTGNSQDKTTFEYSEVDGTLTSSQEFVQDSLSSKTYYYDNGDKIIDKTRTFEEINNFETTVAYTNYSNNNQNYIKTTQHYYSVPIDEFNDEKKIDTKIETYENGLLIKSEYVVHNEERTVVYKYDKNKNLIYEKQDNYAATMYKYKYDTNKNPTKIIIENIENPFNNREINVVSSYK
jgi:YD repeat-containing protein